MIWYAYVFFEIVAYLTYSVENVISNEKLSITQLREFSSVHSRKTKCKTDAMKGVNVDPNENFDSGWEP